MALVGGGFRRLEHSGDAYIEAWGRTLEEAFEAAALALFDVMADTASIRPIAEDRFEVEGDDLEALLYGWLEALLVKFDVDHMLYSKFEVRISPMGPDGGYRLSGRALGEVYDPKRHMARMEVKAVTYHRMEILRSEDGAKVRFLLDL
ncbi:MAG: archease [Candidatus Bathyarchaeia archaeon]